MRKVEKLVCWRSILCLFVWFKKKLSQDFFPFKLHYKYIKIFDKIEWTVIISSIAECLDEIKLKFWELCMQQNCWNASKFGLI